MLGHLGFSYIGLIYLLMLIIPNIIWSKTNSLNFNTDENKILSLLERIGQISCVVILLIFNDFNVVLNDFNVGSFSIWTIWFISSFLMMILYEIAWFKYFKSERELENFYSDFYRIPIPLASLPVISFLLLGIYGGVIWLIISATIFGIGHIGIHLQHWKSIKQKHSKSI